MTKTLLAACAASALALSAGAAFAQEAQPEPTPAPPTQTEPAQAEPMQAEPTPAPSAGEAGEPASATATITAGTAVKDGQGAEIGTVAGVREGASGPEVLISVDGKVAAVPQASLMMSGEGLVSSQTKAQILESAKPPQ